MAESETTWPFGMEPPPGVTVIDTRAARFWRDDDGIVYNQNLVDGVVGQQELSRGLAAVRELTGGHPAVLIAYGGSMSAATREAREYMAGPEADATIAAMGVIVTSPVVRVIMTFFLRWSSPPYETRLHASIDEARLWARGLVGRQPTP